MAQEHSQWSRNAKILPNKLEITKETRSWIKIINKLPSESQNEEISPANQNHQRTL